MMQATKIMADIYAKTASQMHQMRQEARDRMRGQGTLNLGATHDAEGATYHYEPPWKPATLP
jgi:hypothetical protein